MFNKPKRGCTSNIGFSHRDSSKDKIIENKVDVYSNKDKRSELISYNQINNLKKESNFEIGLNSKSNLKGLNAKSILQNIFNSKDGLNNHLHNFKDN